MRERRRTNRATLVALAIGMLAAPARGGGVGTPFPVFEAKDAMTGEPLTLNSSDLQSCLLRAFRRGARHL
jgi:hypothetical protein